MIRGDDWIAGALDIIFNMTIIINDQESELKKDLPMGFTTFTTETQRSQRTHKDEYSIWKPKNIRNKL
jgi:hypothetical protein